MPTLFECWNGCQIYWNGITPPQFVFSYPPANPQVLGFYQLSGRITEVLTSSEWILNMGGTMYDVPNLPPAEVGLIVDSITANMGYAATPIPANLPHPVSGVTTFPLAVWTNVVTGRADILDPQIGLRPGAQILPPRAQFNSPYSSAQLGINMGPGGSIEGGGVANTLVSIGKLCRAGSSILTFLNQLNGEFG